MAVGRRILGAVLAAGLLACSGSSNSNNPPGPAGDSGVDAAADSAPQDTAAPKDTGSVMADNGSQDTAPPPPDTALDSAEAPPPEDTSPGMDSSPADTAPAEDTTPAPDTRPAEDTSAPEDTRPPEDSRPPEDVPECGEGRPCATGRTCCAGACVDTLSDPSRCGGCDTRCMAAGAMAACRMGVCVVGTCDPDRGDCDREASNGCETDTRTSLAHCGACSRACGARAGASVACVAGACRYTCDEGLGDCDGDPANGCETDTRTSGAHCGACGMACAPRPGSAASCAAGACVYACSAGFGDCDGDARNGCETSTRFNAMHCGRCGTACATGGACEDGACRCPGTAGAVCDGVCRDLDSDSRHCGRCGSACATGEACLAAGGTTGESCRPACFIATVRVDLEGQIQLAHAPTWATARSVTGTMGSGAILLDDMPANLAAVIFGIAAVGDVRAEATRVEGILTRALGTGVSPVFVGRAFTTHEGNPGVQSTYRVARSTSATALRDATVNPMIGAAAPSGPTYAASTEFLVEIATVRRTMGITAGRDDIAVTIAPRADAENPLRPTGIRSIDLTNGTALAQASRTQGFRCQTFRATAGAPLVDFLWTVDTSGSMGPYQAQIGRAASQFFDRMRLAGIDFRVGVVTAGNTSINLDSPGFTWIPGTATTGGLQLCERVTTGVCPLSAAAGSTDRLTPYAFAGGSETPVAAAVTGHYTFAQRTARGETNPERRLRAGARFVAVFVTDEPGSNDFSWFSRNRDPETTLAWGTAYNTTTLGNIIRYFQRNSIITYGIVPVSATACSSAAVADLPRCVIEGNRGGAIPIGRATDADVAAALSRLVDAIGGATSPFRLDRAPITSVIRVRVRGVEVPRSRADGFDYDAASQTIVFYGSTYRPRSGDEVVVSYRVWE